MKITRTVNGKDLTFELTPPELIEAYYEQERNYDEDDVLRQLEDLTDWDIQDRYGVTREQMNALLPRIASRYRRYRDHDDSWFEQCESAIEYVAQEYTHGSISLE